MVNRRSFLTGLGALGIGSAGAAASLGAHSQSMGSGSTSRKIEADLATPIIGPRMNLNKARSVMDELKLDALVLGQGVNVYHATGENPITTRMGHPPGMFAIVPRRDDLPISIILSSFTYYYQLSDVITPNDFAIYQYTAPGKNTESSEAAPLHIFPDRKIARLDDIESRRASLTQLAAAEILATPGTTSAFAAAFKDLGLMSANIATDTPSIQPMLETLSEKISVVDADLPLRRIRPVKSDLEIALMRQAANANAEAALAAVRSIRAGATYRDLRSIFYAEAALRGNNGVFMVVDRICSEHYDAPFRDGQSFLIDAVSHGDGYHGDYGRTVFLGEPSAQMAKVTSTIGKAWDEVRHALKPGMRFSEIRELGQSTIKKLGGNYTVSFSPHSVGLYHTDHVGQSGANPHREDIVLEKGMIISVDCPLLESGFGGSAHLEDLTLITADGSEPINKVGDQIILI
jgi:Xaa-Pro aminopeptidase